MIDIQKNHETMHQKIHIPLSNRIYFRCAKRVQCMQITAIYHNNRINKIISYQLIKAFDKTLKCFHYNSKYGFRGNISNMARAQIISIIGAKLKLSLQEKKRNRDTHPCCFYQQRIKC